jgi:hypothetical protein
MEFSVAAAYDFLQIPQFVILQNVRPRRGSALFLQENVNGKELSPFVQ